MSASKMFAADCATCHVPTPGLDVSLFVLTVDRDGLVVLWPCPFCGDGIFRPTPQNLGAVAASGIEIKRSARKYMAARCGPAMGLHLRLPHFGGSTS